MFCALKGATRMPRLRRWRQIAVVNQLLPECDAVPPMNRSRERIETFSLGTCLQSRETGLLTRGGIFTRAFPL